MNPNRARVNFKTFVSKKNEWFRIGTPGRTVGRDGGRTDQRTEFFKNDDLDLV